MKQQTNMNKTYEVKLRVTLEGYMTVMAPSLAKAREIATEDAGDLDYIEDKSIADKDIQVVQIEEIKNE